MRSPMIENASYIQDRENYTDMQVLRSGGGWYVGTLYNNPEGYQEPGSRDSEYFGTKEEAERYLSVLNMGVEAPLRDHP